AESSESTDQAPASPGCGASGAGTRFNLEPRTPPAALPQNETAIDFLPGSGVGGADLIVGGANDFRGFFGALGYSATCYYVHRINADTNPGEAYFEGGLPPMVDQASGESINGGGDAAIEADPPRAAFFIADTRMGQFSSGIGLFRATAAILNNTA